MKIQVKAKYTAIATVEVDADDWDSAVNEVGKLEKHFPYDFLDTRNIKLEETEPMYIVEGKRNG
ncbi:hypothetical protein MTW86_01480 [Mammaliicoccus sciuri]|uniref:hypothetical protein n=1 Tax=Mammaliicoccus sciuri TaxID=1296 RepID=UPI001FB431BA|nr:hypothetical protein [Mammaliicoccus sciuri]MCJ0913249.1 hypothetical protein [Mammaliicoccus sciuri]